MTTTKIIKPTAGELRDSASLDQWLALKPLKPPGLGRCRICWDNGCGICGKIEKAPRRARLIERL